MVPKSLEASPLTCCSSSMMLETLPNGWSWKNHSLMGGKKFTPNGSILLDHGEL